MLHMSHQYFHRWHYGLQRGWDLQMMLTSVTLFLGLLLGHEPLDGRSGEFLFGQDPRVVLWVDVAG